MQVQIAHNCVLLQYTFINTAKSQKITFLMIHKSIFHYLGRTEQKQHVDTSPQQEVSLPLFMGRWYEQARFENWFEDGMENVHTDYSLSSKGWVNITNSGTNSNGTRTRSKGRGLPSGAGRLLVSFVPPYWWFQAPYHILYTDARYQGALISGAGNDFLWLLTREAHPAAELLEKLKEEAQRRGFDTSRLRSTCQSPD